jgi:hypothetical protein
VPRRVPCPACGRCLNPGKGWRECSRCRAAKARGARALLHGCHAKLPPAELERRIARYRRRAQLGLPLFG